jgi:FAD/FMN-containing dehydrogenase
MENEQLIEFHEQHGHCIVPVGGNSEHSLGRANVKSTMKTECVLIDFNCWMKLILFGKLTVLT